jgi:predicted membrane chloride channel (bestrophin family)
MTSSTMSEPLTTSSKRPSRRSASKEYTWEELQAIEARRRQILRRSELPYWKILMYIEGTCLRAISNDWLLWFTISTFVVIRSHAWYSGVLPDFAREVGRLSIDVIGGFLSFFLVLFVNQSNSRFQDMYKESMAACKRIYDVSASVTTAFPAPNAQRMLRYINAAHVAGYVGLSQAYSRHHFFLNLNETYALLSPAEVDLIGHVDMDEGPSAMHELVEWCMKDVDLAYQQKLIEVKDFAALREKIMAFRGSLDTLYEYSDQPIHFFYIHFLCLLSTLYLPLFAASNAYKAGAGNEIHWTADVLSGLIVILQSIFVIGLRMLGRKLVDPYGDDLEDLSVLHYVKTAWQRSQHILNTRFPGDVKPELEAKLQGKQDNRGSFISA